MKNQLLFILFLFPYLGFSQDYLKLFNGDKLNCKIISVSDSMVVFQKNGITKILPEKEVKELFYNKEWVEVHDKRVPYSAFLYNLSQSKFMICYLLFSILLYFLYLVNYSHRSLRIHLLCMCFALLLAVQNVCIKILMFVLCYAFK